MGQRKKILIAEHSKKGKLQNLTLGTNNTHL